MLTLEQFSVLQEKRRTSGLKTDWQYFLFDALICLELDMPDSAMQSLKIALRKAATEIKESE
jgi:hypothetical protein